MKLRALLLAAISACASAGTREVDPNETPAAAEPARPFIKLAARKMALVVYAPPGTSTDGGDYTLEGLLASDLSESYHTEVPTHRRDGAFEGFDDELLAALAQEGADDVVVVELAEPQPGAPIRGTVKVVLTAGEERAWSAEVPTTARPAQDPLRDFAHRAWLAVTRGWIDPGSHPPFDPVAIAQRLAKRKRCDLAAPILAEAIPKLPRASVAEARKVSAAEASLASCERVLALARREEEDARATFRLDLDARALAPKLREAVTAAFAKSKLTQEVAKLTTKPARLVIEPHATILEVRFQPEWYAAQVGDRERYVLGQRALYLDPWLPVIDALLDLRAGAQESLQSSYAEMLGEMRATLRLTKLQGDYVDIDFVERNDRVLFGDQLRVKLEGRSEMTVATPAPGELRKRVFVLGPPEGARGEMTDFGLVWAFFGLKP